MENLMPIEHILLILILILQTIALLILLITGIKDLIQRRRVDKVAKAILHSLEEEATDETKEDGEKNTDKE